MSISSDAVPFIIPEAAPDDAFHGPEFTTYDNIHNNAEKQESTTCTACGRVVTLFLTNHSILQHPVLKVHICEQCYNFYHSGQFTKDEQGDDEHCLWCAEGGNLLLCDICPHAFCNYCIKRNFSKKDFEAIRDSKEWHCFVCNDTPLKSLVKKCSDLCSKQRAYFSTNKDVSNESLLEKSNHFVSEVNEKDQAVAPNNKGSTLTADTESSENEKLFVTPITILRDRETYIVRSKSKSPPHGEKIKVDLRHHSDPENSQDFADMANTARWSNNPLKLPDVKSVEKVEDENLEKSPKIDVEHKADNVPATSKRKNVISSSSGSDNSEFKLSSSGENSDTSMSTSTSDEDDDKGKVDDNDENPTNMESNASQKVDVPSTSGLSNDSNFGKFQSKMQEAEKCISGLSKIFEELSSFLILNKQSGDHSSMGSSPSQFQQYRKTAKFLKTVKTMQSRLSGVELELKVYKKRLGKKRLNGMMSSSDDDDESETELSREKRTSSWTSFRKSSSKSDSSVKLSEPEKDKPSEDAYEENTPSLHNDQHSTPNGKIYDAKVVLKKLSEKDILKFTRKPSKRHPVSDADDTDSSKAAFRSNTGGLSSESSDDFSDDSMKDANDKEPLKKQPKASVKKDIGKSKSSLTEKRKILSEESSDDNSLDSDATEFKFSLNSPDKLGVDQMMEDNDIAIGLLLDKMEGNTLNKTDADVDELLAKNGVGVEKKRTERKNDEKSGKEEFGDEKSDGDEGEMGKNSSKYRHPLLNKKMDISDDQDEEKSKIKSSKKRKASDHEMDARENKKSKRKLDMGKDVPGQLDSSSYESSDSDENVGLNRKKLNTNSSRKIFKIESDSSDDPSNKKQNEKEKAGDKSDIKKTIKKEIKSEDDFQEKSFPKRCEKKRRRLVLNSESEGEEKDDDDNALSSGQKRGRKNIRKILDDEHLSATTIQASQEEMERRKRLATNQDGEMINKEVIVIDDETRTPKKKIIVAQLILSKDPLVEVHSELLKVLKPHQVEGIKFMWDNLIEKVKNSKAKPGGGCILAHCMGLGKTLQSITFLHTVLLNKNLPNVATALVICPYGTINNWVAEFRKWLRRCERTADNPTKRLHVFDLANSKNSSERATKLKHWQSVGGVMVLGYGLFRTLLGDNKRFLRGQEAIFNRCLLDPGPSILICDEGHMLKNANSKIAQIVNEVKTKRRIILTGTPLQNNMTEYHCMVSTVKPKLLGSLKEFKNRFTNPIENGQHVDSTERDVKLMKKRAHVLHELLSGCVQRKDYTCLRSHLLPKYEYVLFVRLSDLQIRMYKHYMSMHSSADIKLRKACLFNDFNTLLLLCCHPRCLVLSKERRELKERANDIKDSDESEESDQENVITISDSDSDSETASQPATEEDLDALSKRKLIAFIAKKSDRKIKTRSRKKLLNIASEYLEKNFCNSPEYEASLKAKSVAELKKIILESGGSFVGCTEKNDLISRIKMLKQSQVDEEWYEKLMPSQENLARANSHSGKIILMLEILHGATKQGDKVVIFSQSLLTLNLIEDVLIDETEDVKKGMTPKIEPHSKWYKGVDFFRLDGSVPVNIRDKWIDIFNNPDNTRGRLFLISTRAGGVGINLIGANRAIVFDASWNPSHDIQSIFRVYRFGQRKPCYIYRFVGQGTMEEKIYERQVVKQSLAFRVVDEQQILRHFSAADIAELYNFKPAPKPVRKRDANGKELAEDTPSCDPPRDNILASIIKANATRDVIVSYHEHDSLLDHQVSEELTEAERRAAWQEYDDERSSSQQKALDSRSPFAAFSVQILRRLAEKADEALNSINRQMTSQPVKSLTDLMQEVRMKNRAMATDTVSHHALQRKLNEHIYRCRLAELRRYITSKKKEIERWIQMKSIVTQMPARTQQQNGLRPSTSTARPLGSHIRPVINPRPFGPPPNAPGNSRNMNFNVRQQQYRPTYRQPHPHQYRPSFQYPPYSTANRPPYGEYQARMKQTNARFSNVR